MANHKARPPALRKARFGDRCRLCSSSLDPGAPCSWTADVGIAHQRCVIEFDRIRTERRRRDAEQARRRRARR